MRTGSVTVLGAGIAAAALVAGCGGDDGGDGAGPDDDVATEEPVLADSAVADDAGVVEDPADTGSDTSAASAASIDPATMPGPAEAVLTVNGETIMYAPPDPEDTRLFTCDLGPEQITVNMQTPDGHDLLVQVAVLDDSGEWAGSIVAKSRDSERNYQGTRTYAADAFAVDGQYMMFVGPFEYYDESDRANFMDAGEGRIAVTCP